MFDSTLTECAVQCMHRERQACVVSCCTSTTTKTQASKKFAAFHKKISFEGHTETRLHFPLKPLGTKENLLFKPSSINQLVNVRASHQFVRDKEGTKTKSTSTSCPLDEK